MTGLFEIPGFGPQQSADQAQQYAQQAYEAALRCLSTQQLDALLATAKKGI